MAGFFGRLFGQKQAASEPEVTEQEQPSESFAYLFKARGTIYQMKEENKYAAMVDAGSCDIVIRHHSPEAGGFHFSMAVASDGETMFEQDLGEAGCGLKYHYESGCIMWAAVIQNRVFHFAFRFVTTDPSTAVSDIAKKFVSIYNQATYCCLTEGQLPPSKIGQDDDEDTAYACGSLSKKQDVSVDADSASTNQQPVPVAPRPTEEDDDDDYFEVVARPSTNNRRSTALAPAAIPQKPKGINRVFADSIQHNRALVIRENDSGGASIQAHRYDENGFVNEAAEVLTVRGDAKSGAELTAPKDGFLMQSGTKLIALDDKRGHGVMEIDLTRGQIVTEYNPGLTGHVINSVTPLDKFGDDPHLLAACTRSCAVTLDTRLDPSKCAVVESGKEITDYMHTLRKNQSFTCHATSQKGHLAIGDATGQIRLFSGPPGSRKDTGRGHHPKTAKTLLKAAPNSIRHLDITADGSYVLATCDKFLLCVCTTYTEDEKSLNGFSARMGKHKPAPLKLDLTAEQVQKVGGPSKIQFGRATFETNRQGEQWITACVGTMIVTWNMKAVKRAMTQRTDVSNTATDEGVELVRVGMRARGDTNENLIFLGKDEIGIETGRTGRDATRRKAMKNTVRFE